MLNKLSYKNQEKVIVFLFLFIPVLLLATFTYYPATNLVINSFTSWDGISEKVFIGFDNYLWIFKDPSVFMIFSHNLAYFVVGLFQICVALFFAVLLSSKLRGRNFFKIVLFMPYVINSIAVAFMMNLMFDNQNGTINIFLRNLGLGSLALSWLGDKNLVNFTMAVMSSWKYMGLLMVIFLAGLQTIPTEYYEAAAIDGATSFQSFRFITLPSISKIIQLAMLLNLNGSLSAFEFPFAIYPLGSPLEMADTFVTKTINTAFRYSSFGLASAMGVVLVLLTAVLILIQNKLLARTED